MLAAAMSRADILAAALALEPSERVALSVELLESLETVEDAADDIEAAWGAEIDRRVEEIDRGQAEGVPADEVFARFGLTF
jgi:putative addiction module component (TIGR02574 family)